MDGHLRSVARTGALVMVALALQAAAGAQPLRPVDIKLRGATLQVVGDTIPDPLERAVGDVARGQALLVARDSANCVLCHALPAGVVRFAGNVGPSLDGVASRLTVAQLRLRVADIQRLGADTVMPSYYRTGQLDRVAPAFAGKPILNAQQLEDVIAYLATLR